VLLVEDDPGDVLIAREALEAAQLDTALDVVSDGAQALAYLRGQDEHAEAARPDLVLLDLNLPGMSGHEVLAAIKDDEQLRRIPVVILSTSSAAEDISKSYDLHANVYVAKPVDFNAFAGVVRKIDEFFGEVVELPRD
jgi:CheY-like chemotaxis protein